MNEAFINVRCTEESGKVGTFLTATKGAADRKAVSPVFSDLYELYDWMRQNGWESKEYVNDTFIPWRVAKS
jgi:hypothetical protein